MARPIDAARRNELLDAVVAYLGVHGLAGLSLRPLAAALGVSVNLLTHHFGSKEDLIVAALRRTGDVQKAVERRWLAEDPNMSQAELLRAWWGWINASAENLAMVRLGIEAAAMEATLGGLPRAVRGEQISVWRLYIEERLLAAGLSLEVAEIEASLVKAMFTGLVVDLLATGDTGRLTTALSLALTRLEQVLLATR